MKTMKFLAAVILSALVFVGCDPVEPEGPTMHKGPIVVNWGNASDVNGKTFDVGMDNWDAEMYQMVVHMMLKNTLTYLKLLRRNKYEKVYKRINYFIYSINNVLFISINSGTYRYDGLSINTSIYNNIIIKCENISK